MVRSKSRTQQGYELYGDIPVMPLMQNSFEKEKSLDKDKVKANDSMHAGDKDHKIVHRSSAGNIPLLELTQD